MASLSWNIGMQVVKAKVEKSKIGRIEEIFMRYSRKSCLVRKRREKILDTDLNTKKDLNKKEQVADTRRTVLGMKK